MDAYLISAIGACNLVILIVLFATLIYVWLYRKSRNL